ncbi:MAG: hypothetical protein N3F64_02125 [Nitrososphaeria archaeon]|nr:hypothetical protein [Nitrososphaeria archaeon]
MENGIEEREYRLLEELMFSYNATSEKNAVSKENLISKLSKLEFFKEKGYIMELSDGRIFLTPKGMQALLAHFS